ncbi:uncharacterized protein LOC144155217 isoform X3 [Haemaphysalis longicornis]
MSHGFLRDMLRLSDCAPCSASSRSGPHRVLSLVAPARLADATGLPRHPWIPVADRQGLGMHRQHEAGASIEVFFGERVGHSEKKRSCNSGIEDTQGIAPQHHTSLGEVQQSHIITWIFERTDSRPTLSTAWKCIFKSRKNRNVSSKATRGVDGVQPQVLHYTETRLRKPKEQKSIFESRKRRGWSPAPHLPLHGNASSKAKNRNASSKAAKTEMHLRKPKEEYPEVASRLHQAKAATQEVPIHTTCFSSARWPFRRTSRGPCS